MGPLLSIRRLLAFPIDAIVYRCLGWLQHGRPSPAASPDAGCEPCLSNMANTDSGGSFAAVDRPCDEDEVLQRDVRGF